jgi:hypothetical protein
MKRMLTFSPSHFLALESQFSSIYQITYHSWSSNCHNPLIRSFTGQNKLDRPLINQHVSMLRFYENIRISFYIYIYLFIYNILMEGVFLTQLSSKFGNLILTNCVGYNKLPFREQYENHFTWSVCLELPKKVLLQRFKAFVATELQWRFSQHSDI